MSLNSASLPENIRRCLQSDSKRALGKHGLTMPEIKAKQDVASEKEMHRQFEQWLRLREIPFGTARMNKRSTFTEGWPDYSLVIKGAPAVFVELKMPGKDLEPEQQKVCAALEAAGAIVRVCESLGECICVVLDLLKVFRPESP